jgi:hypothetical protein
LDDKLVLGVLGDAYHLTGKVGVLWLMVAGAV